MKETKNISNFSLFGDNILVIHIGDKLRLFDLIKDKTIKTLTNVDLFSIRNSTIENSNKEDSNKIFYIVDKKSNIKKCQLEIKERSKSGFILSSLISNNENKFKVLQMETYNNYIAIIYSNTTKGELFLSIILLSDDHEINKVDIQITNRSGEYSKENLIIRISSNEEYFIIGFLNTSKIKVFQRDTYNRLKEISSMELEQKNITDLTILPSYFGEYLIYRVENEIFLKEYIDTNLTFTDNPTISKSLITSRGNKINCIDIFVQKKETTNTLIRDLYQIFIICGLNNSNIEIWSFTHYFDTINSLNFVTSFQNMEYIKTINGNGKSIKQLKYNGHGLIISLDDEDNFRTINLFKSEEKKINMNNYIYGFNNNVNPNYSTTSKKMNEDDKNETLLKSIEKLNNIINVMIYREHIYEKFNNDSLIQLISEDPKRLVSINLRDIEIFHNDTNNVAKQVLQKSHQKYIKTDEIYIYLQYTLEILYKYYKQNEKNIKNYFESYTEQEPYSILQYNEILVNSNIDEFTIYILKQLNELHYPLVSYFLYIRNDFLKFDEKYSIIGDLLLTIKALLFIIEKYIKFTIITNFLLTINRFKYRGNFDMVMLSMDKAFFNNVKRLLKKIPIHKKSSLVISNINETIKSMKHIQTMSKQKLEALQFFTNFSITELKKLKKFGSNETLKYKVYEHHITNRLNQNTTNKNEKKLNLFKNKNNNTKKRGFFRRTFNKFKSLKKMKKGTIKNIENGNIQVVDKNLSIVEYLKNYENIEDFTDEDKNAILKLMDKSIKKQLFDMLSQY